MPRYIDELLPYFKIDLPLPILGWNTSIQKCKHFSISKCCGIVSVFHLIIERSSVQAKVLGLLVVVCLVPDMKVCSRATLPDVISMFLWSVIWHPCVTAQEWLDNSYLPINNDKGKYFSNSFIYIFFYFGRGFNIPFAI